MKEDRSVDLLDVLTTLARRKASIIKIMVSAVVIGLVVALLWPKSYKSELTYIVTEGNSINFSSGGILNGLANLSVSGNRVTADQVIILLRNKAILDQMIEEFNLEQVYGAEVQEHLREMLDNNIEVEEFREGGIGFNSIIATNVAISDEEPKRSYEMLTYFFDKVDSTVQQINKKSVEDGYLMLQQRLEQNEQELKEAEDSLLSFQMKYGIIEVEEQAKGLIEAIASVRAEMVKLDVQIGFLEEISGGNNPELSKLRAQKNEYQETYNELLNSEQLSENEFDVYKSLSEMPPLALEYMRRYRELEVQQEIYKVLLPQFEQQKLNYEEVNSGIELVDPPKMPTYKDSPKRAYIVLAFMLFGMIFSLLYVLYKEWTGNLKENKPQDYQRFQNFWNALKFGNGKN